jgi:hypothetical protein
MVEEKTRERQAQGLERAHQAFLLGSRTALSNKHASPRPSSISEADPPCGALGPNAHSLLELPNALADGGRRDPRLGCRRVKLRFSATESRAVSPEGRPAFVSFASFRMQIRWLYDDLRGH